MSLHLAELDYAETGIGELILRRRRYPVLGDTDVFEVILNDEFLMSSLFTAGEIALANLGLGGLPATAPDVVVGGLGLGYTAAAALAHDHVASVAVIEALPQVAAWHERGLLPVSAALTGDPRCSLHVGDFFAQARSGFGLLGAGRRFDAVLLDIDHSPRHVLRPENASFYTGEGLGALREILRDGGVFALWSNDPPDDAFTTLLGQVFARCHAHVIDIDNPLTGITGHNTIYVAVR